MKKQIEDAISSLYSKELPLGTPISAPWERGSVQQHLRMKAVAILAAENFEGDFCEIGVMTGSTTSMLAQIAREYGRRVIGVDPFEDGRPNYNPVNYDKFIKNTGPWKDIIDFLRLPSEDEQVIRFIKERNLAFAYVDGAHDYEHCSRDLKTVSHAKIVCADDMWFEDVIKAVEETGRESIYNALGKEAYLL